MKGIIVAGGYGTRFLPATKTLAKEMLPLIDKPAIAFVVEEFINSGITDIIIVTSKRKGCMDNYFDREAELEAVFAKEGAKGQAKQAKIEPYKGVNICFVRQTEAIGSGDALLKAYPWLGGDSAVVAYPDDVHFGEVPLAKQLIDAHTKSGKCICAAQFEKDDVSRYGVFSLAPDGYSVKGFIEKPAQGQEPSHQISIGRYLFTNQYFKQLAEAFKSYNPAKGEFYHVYGLTPMIEQNQVEIVNFSGTRLDTGEPCGYLQAILHYAKTNPQYNQVLKQFSL